MRRVLGLCFYVLHTSSAWMHYPSMKRPWALLSMDSDITALVGSEEVEDEPAVYVARCPDTKRVIECYLDTTVEVKGETYVVLHPCDEVVGIAAFDEFGQADLIGIDSKLMDEVFPAAAALFEEDDIELMRTASVLTMQGDWEAEEADEEWAEEEEEAASHENSDEDQVEVLSDFELNDDPYALVRIMEPTFLIGKMCEGKTENEILLLSDTEGASVWPAAERVIIELRSAASK